MTEEHEFFSPERVDEQIDHLFQNEMRPRFARRQPESSYQVEKHLVTDLHGYYRTEKQEDLASLENAWKRVSPHLVESMGRSQHTQKPLSQEHLKVSLERIRPMYSQTPERPKGQGARRWLAMFAAVLVAALLVGGLVTVLNLSNHTKTAAPTQTGLPATQPTITPTSQPLGTTIYTTPASQANYTNFYWSPDSKRIASFSDNINGGLHIWDAATGGNAVTFALPGLNEWIMSIAWSPVSSEIAVGTNQRLLIIDGQTGAIRHAYGASVASASAFHSPYLSSMLPTSNGAGYRSLSWSPDGKELAVGLSYGPNGSLQIWNIPQGNVTATFTLGSSYVINGPAWSSDGKYLAAHGFDTQASDPFVASDIVVAWDVSSQQTIFKKTLVLDGSDASLYWQPQSHNLAFARIVAYGGEYISSLDIWNVLSGKEVHLYKGKGGASLAFSSDGQQVAYDGFIGKGDLGDGVIAIMDVNSGAQIYTYKGGNGALAWSPNGKYIVSAFNGLPIFDKQGHPVFKNGRPETNPSYARVWIA